MNKKLYLQMLRIRKIEEAIAKKYHEQEMRCPVHLSIGQEAPAVGVCNALDKEDWVFSGHRSHAHYLAKGGDLSKMLAEIYGKETGCSLGRGGSMHLNDLNAGFIGATPIVGSTVPIAVGAALTIQFKNFDSIAVIFLGDGAMETGVVQESLNFASLRKVPILFVCENNLYSVYSPLSVRQPSNRSLSDIAISHGLKAFVTKENDVENIYEITLNAKKLIKENKESIFLEIPTYRWLEHCGPNLDNNIGYRIEEEYIKKKNEDMLDLFIKNNNSSELKSEIKKIDKEILDAFNFAISSPFPKPNTAECMSCINKYT